MADLDPDNLHRYRVVDLKEILTQRGLSTSGLKADLVKRLRESLLFEIQDSSSGQNVGDDVAPDQEIQEPGLKADEPQEWQDDENTNEGIMQEEVIQVPPEMMVEEPWGAEGSSIEEQRLQQEIEHQRQQQEIEQQEFEQQRQQQDIEQQEFERLRQQREIEQQRQQEIQQQQIERQRQEHELQRQQQEIELQRQHEIELKRQHEIERQKQLEVEQQRQQEIERQNQLKVERQKQLEVEQHRQQEIERQTRQQEIERQRQLQEVERHRQQEIERQRQQEIERQRQQEIERQRQQEMAEQRIRRHEEDVIRQLEETKKRREIEAAEKQQQLAVAEKMRKIEEAEKSRKMEEAQRKASEEEKKRQLDEQLDDENMGDTEDQTLWLSEEQHQRGNRRVKNWPTQHDQIPPPVSILFDDITHPRQPMSITSHMVPGFIPPSPPTSIKPIGTPSVLSNTDSAADSFTSSDAENISNPVLDVETESIKLPHAVEKLFALKTERAQQLGVDPDEVVQPRVDEDKENTPSSKSLSKTFISVEDFEEDLDDVTPRKAKENLSKKKRKKKKKRAAKRSSQISGSEAKPLDTEVPAVDIDIEYVQDVLDPSDPLYSQFIKIFEKFKLTEPEKEKADAAALEAAKEEAKAEQAKADRKKAAELNGEDDEDMDDDDDKKDDDDKPKLSKRKLKKLSRMSVAELKQKVNRPELVEMHDVTARDPVLLLHLKASRNTVPVPRHWCFKRKYLQGKRGIEKPAFELPDFIKRTGIMEMRQALQEKEDQKTMKAKMRERVRPKLGKIDIDYQKLHDAFFKWQTKPKMTIHGDLYYEGKEFETRLKEKKPGDLSDDLRIALGMPTGPNANKCPPPWLIAMQRYGPPPSYPNLKIPGLNAPIPDGCSFGYHAGGWGKPPVDEMGRPLYGDVFGIQSADNMPHMPEEEIDHTLWGELESESSEEEEEEEDEDDEDDEAKDEDETGLVTPAEGLITPSGFSSIPAGMETPDMIELRKRKIEAEMEGGETPALYTILPEKKSERVGASMMGSTHIYDLAGAIPTAKSKTPGTASVPPQGIEVALDPSELEMDTAAMAARYEQTMREQQSQLEKEDLSDMVAEHAARQKTKRKRQQQDSGKAPKKYKEFKF